MHQNEPPTRVPEGLVLVQQKSRDTATFVADPTTREGCRQAWASSYELGPVIVWHQAGTGPVLAVGICTLAGEESVLSMLENGNPRRGFRVLDPLENLLMGCPDWIK